LNKLDPDIYYFIGKTFEYCALIITKKKKYLVVPKLEHSRAKEAAKGKSITIRFITQRNLSEMIKSLNLDGRIGVNYEYISLSESESLKKARNILLIDISKELIDMRMQKDAMEISNIRTAARHADDIIREFLKKMANNNNNNNDNKNKNKDKKSKEFRTEMDILKFLDNETRKRGMSTSFKPIIASGKNSANPHHDSKDRLRKGFCVIDFGAKYKGYCSDMTRTIYLGRPTKEEEKIYYLVLKANEDSIRYCSAAKKCSDIDIYCRKILGKHEKNFIHGLGHGIGVEIHEGPTLNSKSKDILKEGMIFTIEPGIYLENRFGIRIEDDILLMKDGKKDILTKTTKKLLCFDL
jgi:Xaa-Pro aminopeptidase